MDINLSSLCTLAPEAPCYKFSATRRQVYCRFDKDGMAFDLTWHYTQTHTKYKQGPTDWHKYTLTPSPVMLCAHSSYHIAGTPSL